MDNDNKKSAGVKVPTDRQLTTNSGVTGSTPVPPQFHPPTGNESVVNAFTPLNVGRFFVVIVHSLKLLSKLNEKRRHSGECRLL